MQRVPVALKLGYKGPRRRFLRHICGQVQEWLKFLILFFREYKVRACSNQFLHWQFILALLFYQVHVQFPPTCVEYIDKVSNFAGTDLQSGGEKVINFTVAFYLSHFYLRSVFFTGQQSGNRNVRYKKKTFYHFLLIWVNASLWRDELSVFGTVEVEIYVRHQATVIRSVLWPCFIFFLNPVVSFFFFRAQLTGKSDLWRWQKIETPRMLKNSYCLSPPEDKSRAFYRKLPHWQCYISSLCHHLGYIRKVSAIFALTRSK